jgi:sodium-dependent dicarboxylate transporter 2/3/5
VAFAPIAASVLMASGYDTVESRWNSFSASNLMIALAWGSSHGGFGTPLGGGQALVVYQMLGKEIGHNIAFIDWTMRAVPPTLFTAIFIVAFLRWGMKYDVEKFSGSRELYREELKKLGPMNRGEWISLVGFLFAIAVAFLEPLYKNLLPVTIEPAAIFLLVAIIMFFIPATKDGEKVIGEEMVKKHFPITAVIVWPTAVALAAILEMSGATKVMASWLAPLASASPAVALAGFTGLAGLMTQFSTNTAANAVVVPMAVSTMKAVGQSVVPWSYAVGLMGSLGYAVVSASGGIAVVVAYGANIRRMFTNGLIAFAIAWVANWVFWYLVMYVFKIAFYFRT